MYKVLPTKKYRKDGLPGESVGAYIISDDIESIDSRLNDFCLDCMSGTFTQLVDESAADDIIQHVIDNMKKRVSDIDYDFENDFDIFYIQKIKIGDKFYVNMMYVEDVDSSCVHDYLQDNGIDHIEYGADINDYDPMYAFLDFINDSDDDITDNLKNTYEEMKNWLIANVKLENTDPENHEEWEKLPDCTLSYSRWIVEYGID